MSKKLIIVLGPTAVGKTDYSIDLALKYGSPVISCDSRQIYREMTIGTAVPSKEQLAAVRHYFIQTKSVTDYYTAGKYEIEALALIRELFSQGHDTLVMTGGSMFYIDAVCNGIPDVPEADPELRARLTRRIKEEGPLNVAEDLKELDPEAYRSIDRSNGMRVLRGLEVCLGTGKPFSSFARTQPRERDFQIEKIGISRPREELYRRIDARVDQMFRDGLIKEVRSLTQFRNLTALNTVGYKEVFTYLDNPDTVSLDQTIALVKQDTRHYAKRQMTWWRRDGDIRWINL